MIAALAREDTDICPLDGYAHDLLHATEPDFAKQMRIPESTEQTPIPPIFSTAPRRHAARRPRRPNQVRSISTHAS
jgi:hypothetical protein